MLCEGLAGLEVSAEDGFVEFDVVGGGDVVAEAGFGAEHDALDLGGTCFRC